MQVRVPGSGGGSSPSGGGPATDRRGAGAFPGAALTDLAGMLAGLALIGYELLARRRQAAATPATAEEQR